LPITAGLLLYDTNWTVSRFALHSLCWRHNEITISVQFSSIGLYTRYTPFTRSSKHRADIKQTSSRHLASVEQTSSWLVQLTYSQLVEPAWSCKRGI